MPGRSWMCETKACAVDDNSWIESAQLSKSFAQHLHSERLVGHGDADRNTWCVRYLSRSPS